MVHVRGFHIKPTANFGKCKLKLALISAQLSLFLVFALMGDQLKIREMKCCTRSIFDCSDLVNHQQLLVAYLYICDAARKERVTLGRLHSWVEKPIGLTRHM